MNILPKKRWHVRTKDNIARVRRDEAKAREEEEEQLRRKQLAEKEARINELRIKTGATNVSQPTSTVTSSQLPGAELKHVNLFADYEEGIAQSTSVNKQHCKEKLEETQRYEKQIGLLTFLGQDTNEALKLKSWYEVPRKDLKNSITNEEKDANIKYRYDPLNLIRQKCPKDKKSYDIRKPYEIPKKIVEKEKTEEKTESDKHKTKDKKSKKKKKDKDKDKKKSIAEKLNQEKETLDRLRKLREERLRRETMEKSRQELVILKSKGLPLPQQTKPQQKSREQSEGPIITQKYNSQFNPHIAKQNFND